MRTSNAYGDLLRMRHPVVTTGEVATRLKTPTPNATKRLKGLEEAGLALLLRRGLWSLDPQIEPFAVAPFLTSPYPAYISFWSALNRHGMIEQIPRYVSVASLARSRKISTTIGQFEIHHLKPEIFGGFDGSSEDGFVATPEKALFDTVYVRAAAGKKAHFPELEIPRRFRQRELEVWSKKIVSSRLRTIVSQRLNEVLRDASAQ
jgi:predicted transcriptional regulator of viral defense system